MGFTSKVRAGEHIVNAAVAGGRAAAQAQFVGRGRWQSRCQIARIHPESSAQLVELATVVGGSHELLVEFSLSLRQSLSQGGVLGFKRFDNRVILGQRGGMAGVWTDGHFRGGLTLLLLLLLQHSKLPLKSKHHSFGLSLQILLQFSAVDSQLCITRKQNMSAS